MQIVTYEEDDGGESGRGRVVDARDWPAEHSSLLSDALEDFGGDCNAIEAACDDGWSRWPA